MNALPSSGWLLTVEEYLAFEEQSDVRHEYVGGEIHAMVGATFRHARIVTNLVARLWTELRGTACDVVSSDMKLQVAPDTIYYPDIIVTCDPEDVGPLILENPTLLVEVLSPSTAAIDRREKMRAYRQLSSLVCYLVVHQDQRLVERHWRDAVDAPWGLEMVDDSPVRVPGLDINLALDDIYEGIELGPLPSDAREA